MTLNSLEGIKFVPITIQSDGGWPVRHIYKLTRKGQVLGYVARSLTSGAPIRDGWSYCTEDAPEQPCNWTRVGPGSKREDAVDRLLSAISPSAAWLA